MTFAALQYIHALWGVLLIILFLLWAFHRRSVLLKRFAHITMLERLTTHVSRAKQYIKAVCGVAALLFIVFALMQPLWGYTWETHLRRGADIMVAVDVSRSMLSHDIVPSRLDRAKRAAMDLLQLLQGERIGLIAFAGRAYIQCPLTHDYDAMRLFINELDPRVVPVGGTRVDEAIRKAIDAFQDTSETYRILVVITDGEDHGGDPIGAAELAARHNIRIISIGIGTPDGSPIIITETDGSTTFLRDAQGNVVVSRLDEDTLTRIALITNGAYVRATPAGNEIDDLYYTHIATADMHDDESAKRKRHIHRFQWPLAGAALFCITDALIGVRTRRAHPKPIDHS